MSNRRNRPQGFSTRAIHLGYDPASEQGALTPPIYMTSTFAFETAEAGSEMFRGERAGYIYGRTRNPTQTILEERMASLEGGEVGMTTASGMAAMSSVMMSLLSAGDEVVIDHTLYGNTFAYFTQALPRFGIIVRIADFMNPETLTAQLSEKTRVVYFETPANPNLRVIDIAEIVRRAHKVKALVVVDNTFATPALQRPLEYGADVIVHSATKYLGGHGDLLGGIVVGPKETMTKVRQTGLRWITGATLSPFNCFPCSCAGSRRWKSAWSVILPPRKRWRNFSSSIPRSRTSPIRVSRISRSMHWRRSRCPASAASSASNSRAAWRAAWR